MPVPNARKWAAETPELYDLDIYFSRQTRVISRSSHTPTGGFRCVELKNGISRSTFAMDGLCYSDHKATPGLTELKKVLHLFVVGRLVEIFWRKGNTIL